MIFGAKVFRLLYSNLQGDGLAKYHQKF